MNMILCVQCCIFYISYEGLGTAKEFLVVFTIRVRYLNQELHTNFVNFIDTGYQFHFIIKKSEMGNKNIVQALANFKGEIDKISFL